MLMHHMLIVLTCTSIQGNRDLNHENNQMVDYFRNYKAMSIKFAVKIVRLKVYMTVASLMTLTFIQGHKRVSNLTTF